MRLTDISLNWVLAGAVLLVGFLAAVVLIARGRKQNEDPAQADSWERMEERRRRKETAYASASYILLFCCAGVAAALSFQGLVGFGRENLGLGGGWEYLVPFGLDGAAMFCAVLAVREASQGDASLGSRLLVWAFAGAAAWFNWVHAPRGEGHEGAPHFFAGMSISAAILFDRALKQTRKAALREQGLVPRPLPQIRVVRWFRAPRETFGAWSLMLLEGVRTLDEAVDEVRDERKRKEQEKERKREHAKLEKARLRALNRQHRMLGRGAAPEQQLDKVEVEIGTPTAQPAAVEPSALPVRSRPALQRADDGVQTGHVEPGRRKSDPDVDDESSQASPRLDSLEEKLAEIERQFG